MIRKTESLAYPSNPLDAMRELQELDAAPAPLKPATGIPPAVALPRELPTSSAVAHATGVEVAHATDSEVAQATGSAVGSATMAEKEPRPRPPARNREPDTAGPASAAGENPVAKAMREMLGKPYTCDEKRGPFTVSTVKIPTEVWERLGFAATLADQPKQEIISEALKAYFAKLIGRK
jgi:hypothetical protein